MLRNKHMVMINGLILLLFLFALVIFQTSPKTTKYKADNRLSYLNLIQYINGYRDVQQDFHIEDLKFGDKFLNFTMNIQFKSKSILVIKKLALDIIEGLTNEYPELESIKIKVRKDNPGEDSVTEYGQAEYSKSDNSISWHYQ